jgi:hypothetical protein
MRNTGSYIRLLFEQANSSFQAWWTPRGERNGSSVTAVGTRRRATQDLPLLLGQRSRGAPPQLGFWFENSSKHERCLHGLGTV